MYDGVGAECEQWEAVCTPEQNCHVMFVSGNTPEGIMRVTVMKSDAQLAGSC